MVKGRKKKGGVEGTDGEREKEERGCRGRQMVRGRKKKGGVGGDRW